MEKKFYLFIHKVRGETNNQRAIIELIAKL